MIREYEMDCVQGVRDGMFIYQDNGVIEKIDIKKSAEFWWDKHYKSTIMYVLLKTRTKNKYAERSARSARPRQAAKARKSAEYSL